MRVQYLFKYRGVTRRVSNLPNATNVSLLSVSGLDRQQSRTRSLLGVLETIEKLSQPAPRAKGTQKLQHRRTAAGVV